MEFTIFKGKIKPLSLNPALRSIPLMERLQGTVYFMLRRELRDETLTKGATFASRPLRSFPGAG